MTIPNILTFIYGISLCVVLLSPRPSNEGLSLLCFLFSTLSFPGGNSSSEHQPVPLLTQEKHLRGFLTDVIDCAFSSTRQHTDRQLYSTFGPGPTQQLPLFHREA